MSRSELQPDGISYSAALSACEKGVYWEVTLRFLRAMPRRTLQPELFSCNAALSSCEKGMQ